MQQYIEDPDQYFQQMQNHKKVLAVKQEIKGYQLYDISLHRKGPMEDKLYLKNSFFIVNIRRGNSLLQDEEKMIF